jgi:hypothetical protein
METIILQTENNQTTKELLDLIKNMKSVKFIAVENDIYKINTNDLALPGRALNEEELENIAIVMENETDFKKSDDVFEEIINSIKKK